MVKYTLDDIKDVLHLTHVQPFFLDEWISITSKHEEVCFSNSISAVPNLPELKKNKNKEDGIAYEKIKIKNPLNRIYLEKKTKGREENYIKKITFCNIKLFQKNEQRKILKL